MILNRNWLQSGQNRSLLLRKHTHNSCPPCVVTMSLYCSFYYSIFNDRIVMSLLAGLLHSFDSKAFNRLFCSLSGSLSRSQFPVFTIHAQKSCLGVRPCSKAWCIDRVQGYRLVDHVKSAQMVSSRRDCLELCLGETDFTCR